jgi:hypothetical protein
LLAARAPPALAHEEYENADHTMGGLQFKLKEDSGQQSTIVNSIESADPRNGSVARASYTSAILLLWCDDTFPSVCA